MLYCHSSSMMFHELAVVKVDSQLKNTSSKHQKNVVKTFMFVQIYHNKNQALSKDFQGILSDFSRTKQFLMVAFSKGFSLTGLSHDPIN